MAAVHCRILFIYLVVVLALLAAVVNGDPTDPCFCQLNGDIGDCECTSESVDVFNNKKIFPILDALLRRDYFRYYKVDLFRPCPFAESSAGQCSSRGCAVDHCRDSEIPAGLKDEKPQEKYSKHANENHSDDDCKKLEQQEKLGKLDVELSQESRDAFASWAEHDDQQENFCETEDVESPNAEFYDLVRNPERFTGYAGQSAVNIWKLIYDQNCFKPDKPDYEHYLSAEQQMCLEKRVFFRLISGFHTSINVDVVANWLIPANNAFEAPRWGPNIEEFVRRFDPRTTYGEGPRRLQNMYFAYLVEMRALIKVAPYLSQELFFTGNELEDEGVRTEIGKLLDLLKSFPSPFDESKLFQGNARKLKEDFKIHFRNISRIIDCVGCDKCRLWGKLQFSGLATALKILFSGDSMSADSIVTHEHKHSPTTPFLLRRSEIVALFNGFGRLSKSLHEVDYFRHQLTK